MLSKKQQKKLKQLQKAANGQNKQLQSEQQSLKHQINKKNKNSQKQQQHHQQQQAVQQQNNNNGDIDFNQIKKVQDDQEKIDVTFLIAEIREEYYHSMKTVLLRYGQVIGVTQSQIAGEVLQNGNLGNVVVAEDDQQQDEEENQEEDNNKEQENQNQQNDQLNIYSVLTLLPPNLKITNKVIKQALTSLQKHKPQLNNKSITKCQQLLKSPKSCSLLINARLPNLPSFIVSDSHQVFANDLQELRKKQPKNKIFAGEYILNVSEVQVVNSSTKQLDELVFSKFEDYEFCLKSVCWWVGESVKSQREKADLRKLYFVIRLKDYLQSVKNIKTYLDDYQLQQ